MKILPYYLLAVLIVARTCFTPGTLYIAFIVITAMMCIILFVTGCWFSRTDTNGRIATFLASTLVGAVSFSLYRFSDLWVQETVSTQLVRWLS
jgi:uncharacterized membrane protein